MGIKETIMIRIAPLAEQCRIAAKMEQRMALVITLETQLAFTSKTIADQLSKSAPISRCWLPSANSRTAQLFRKFP